MDDAAIDGSHVRALKKGAHTGPSPTDCARPGSKHHLITDRPGAPLAVSLTSGTVTTSPSSCPYRTRSPESAGLVGRPRHRPRRLFADRGYDYDKYCPRWRSARIS
ncbi:transposase [Streptomyces albogriseolus]|uniref:transposase n=1 Tax=Streptomyces albogriseolus TaxID=1887 RepID=UPI0037BC618B